MKYDFNPNERNWKVQMGYAIFYIITWYTILYAGGIFLFYLMLYKEMEKNKI